MTHVLLWISILVIEVTHAREGEILREYFSCVQTSAIPDGTRVMLARNPEMYRELERLLAVTRAISTLAVGNISSCEDPRYRRARWKMARSNGIVTLEVSRSGAVDLGEEMDLLLGVCILIGKIDRLLARRAVLFGSDR